MANRVLAEANIGVGRHNFLAYGRQILSRWFGFVQEATVGLVANAKNITAKVVQQAIAKNAACTSVAVDQDSKAALADAESIDRRQDFGQMVRSRIRERMYFLGGHCGVCIFALVIRGQHLLADPSRNDAPFGPKQLEPVIFGRIVTGRNLNSASRIVLTNQHTERRRGGNFRVEHAATGRKKRRNHSVLDGRPVFPPVPADNDRAGHERVNERGDITRSHLRREAFPHDATKAGNADNGFTHAAAPCLLHTTFG
jgi:hypothetical protein